MFGGKIRKRLFPPCVHMKAHAVRRGKHDMPVWSQPRYPCSSGITARQAPAVKVCLKTPQGNYPFACPPFRRSGQRYVDQRTTGRPLRTRAAVSQSRRAFFFKKGRQMPPTLSRRWRRQLTRPILFTWSFFSRLCFKRLFAENGL